MNRTTGISRCLPPYGAHSLVIEAPAVALPFIERGDNIYLCQNDSQLRLEN